MLETANDLIEKEMSNYIEAKDSAGINCCGACMASGALDVLRIIKEGLGG